MSRSWSDALPRDATFAADLGISTGIDTPSSTATTEHLRIGNVSGAFGNGFSYPSRNFTSIGNGHSVSDHGTASLARNETLLGELAGAKAKISNYEEKIKYLTKCCKEAGVALAKSHEENASLQRQLQESYNRSQQASVMAENSRRSVRATMSENLQLREENMRLREAAARGMLVPEGSLDGMMRNMQKSEIKGVPPPPHTLPQADDMSHNQQLFPNLGEGQYSQYDHHTHSRTPDTTSTSSTTEGNFIVDSLPPGLPAGQKQDRGGGGGKGRQGGGGRGQGGRGRGGGGGRGTHRSKKNKTRPPSTTSSAVEIDLSSLDLST